MKVVVQRVLSATCEIDNNIYSKIDRGLLLYVGFTEQDNEQIIDKYVNKIVNLRIFEDEDEKMNQSAIDNNYSILSISQFTLYGDCKKGYRPSFIKALNPVDAEYLYNVFNDKLASFGLHVETGIFRSTMKISSINDGPVTIIMELE